MNTKKKIFLIVVSLLLPQLNLCTPSSTYITGNGFRGFADYIVERNNLSLQGASIKQKSVIYVEVDALDYFFKNIFPKIEVPFVLLTHNGDTSAPGRFVDYLNSPKILKWFGQNCDIAVHPKFCPIPIGLANEKYAHGHIPTFKKARLYSKTLHDDQRKFSVYMNFSETHPIRGYVYRLFKNNSLVEEATPKPLMNYLMEMARYKFILSPFGNGLDCHRTWEALLVGCIPIVQTSTLDPLYDGLPVIIVKEWEEITPDYLVKKHEEMRVKKFNNKKLFLKYWFNLIDAARS